MTARGIRLLTYLGHYPVVHSHDSEFARHELTNTYGAIGFDARGGDFGIRASYARLASVGIAFCAYDSAVSLSFPEDGIVRQFFSIEGRASFSTANASQPIGSWSPVIPGESRLRLDFAPRYKQLVLRFDGLVLERAMASLLGDAGGRKLVFSSDKPNWRAWLSSATTSFDLWTN